MFKDKKIVTPVGKYFQRIVYKNWFYGISHVRTYLNNGVSFTKENFRDILQDAKENNLRVSVEQLAGII